MTTIDLVYEIIFVVVSTSVFLLCLFCPCSHDARRREEQRRAAALVQAAQLAAPMEQGRRLAAAAPMEPGRRLAAAAPMEPGRRLAAAVPAARVVKKELGYFPYSAAVEASGERLVCAICLEVFLHGAACSEVPA
jgi:hypothetical protein